MTYEAGSKLGEEVFSVSNSEFVEDPDNKAGTKQRMSYSIEDGNVNNMFMLKEESGKFLVNSWLLDREHMGEYHITISVLDDGLIYKWDVKKETVNDHYFDATVQELWISNRLKVETLTNSQHWTPPLTSENLTHFWLELEELVLRFVGGWGWWGSTA